MTDKSTSGTKYIRLSALERERNCREIFCRDHEGEYSTIERLRTYGNYLSNISPRKICIDVEGTWEPRDTVPLDNGEEISISSSRLEFIRMLVLENILPAIHGIDEIDAFVAERAVLSGWMYICSFCKGLSKMNSVPMLAYQWGKEYLSYPQTKVIPEYCGYLVAAGWLEKGFSEDDFYQVAFELARISVELCLDKHDYGYFELTQEGIQKAITTGLLDADESYRYSDVIAQRILLGLTPDGHLPVEPDETEEPAPTSTGEEIKTDNKPLNGEPVQITGDVFTIKQLIARNKIPDYKQGAFEQAMKRWRKSRKGKVAMGTDIILCEHRRRNESQFYYRENAVPIQNIIKKYQEKS